MMNKNLQIHVIRKQLGENADLCDVTSEVDSTLRLNENINNMKQTIKSLKPLIKDEVKDDYNKEYEALQERYNNEIQKYDKDYSLKKIFKDSHIVALVGIKNSGKTNNLVSMIKEFRDNKNTTPIYIYGFRQELVDYLKEYDCIEISELRHLIGKKDCIFICDEFQKLKLNDRRYTDERDEFKNYVYHNNVYVLLSSPDPREFNSIIGSMIEKWTLKTVSLTDCVNGSQLKKAIEEYKGNYKYLGSIELSKDTILVINKESEQKIICEYIVQADTKKLNKNLF